MEQKLQFSRTCDFIHKISHYISEWRKKKWRKQNAHLKSFAEAQKTWEMHLFCGDKFPFADKDVYRRRVDVFCASKKMKIRIHCKASARDEQWDGGEQKVSKGAKKKKIVRKNDEWIFIK